LALASANNMFLFNQFVAKYGKYYHTQDEFEYRYNAFVENLAKIDALNARNIAAGGQAVFGINTFADMPAYEFAQRLMKNLTYPATTKATMKHPSLLTDIDWRTKGAVSAVKDQGQCGSCWAFSATEATESYGFLSSVFTLQELSAQQVTACTYNYNGCNGGWPYDGYENGIIKRKGEDSNAEYPYNIAQAGNCKFGATGAATNPVENMSSYKSVARGGLADTLAAGPPSVCVAAEEWQTYTGGVLKTCAGSVDHCVQAVGIGGTGTYWIVRNSWGTSWGEKGYIYLDSSVDNGDICHIQEYITYPTGFVKP